MKKMIVGDSSAVALRKIAAMLFDSGVCLGCVLACALLAPTAQAAQLFQATVVSTDAGPPLTVTAGGSSLLDFFDDVTNDSGAFSAFSTRDGQASWIFLGVPNALRTSRNSSGSQVVIDMPRINFSKTFIESAPGAGDASNAARDFFTGADGSAIISKFWKDLSKSSFVAQSDGNPTASTAQGAGTTFMSQGFTSADDLSAASDGEKPRFGGLSFGINAGTFEAGPFSGQKIDLSATVINIGLGERMRLQAPFSATYMTIEGASVFAISPNLALPIRLRIMDKEQPWNWKVTPFVGTAANISMDMGTAALIWQAGVVNTVDYRINRKLIISVVSQISYHKSIAINAGDFSYDPDINQQILKNGFRVVSPLAPRWLAEGFLIDTRFLQDAAVEQFWTLGGGLSYRLAKRFNIGLAANFDTGDSYKAYGIGLNSAWKW